jgi:hypothetical protein
MSVIFTYTGGSLTVGGGGSNPYPRYSISTAPNTKQGITYSNTYTINVTGTFIATGDITTVGARANSIMTEVAAELLQTGTNGSLLINSPSGQNLNFTNAKLISVEAAEQDDVSQGVLTQEFSASFEAFNLASGAVNDSGYYTAFEDGLLEDFDESWEWSISEENDSNPSTGDVDRPWTCTLSVSATGRGASGVAYDQAKSWVTGRTSGVNPLAPTDLAGTSITLENLPSSGYNAFNKVTSRNQNVAGGTYGETITWTYSKYKARCTVDVSGTFNPADAQNTVEVSVNIQGYEDDLEADASAKYANALSFYETNVVGNLSTWAASHYTNFIQPLFTASRTLNGNAVSQSVTSNETDGVITVASNYNDKNLESGAIDQNVSINDSTVDGSNQIVAILPVIAKSNGPVIQNMATTGERTRSISVEITMDQNNRSIIPRSQGQSALNPYIPVCATAPVYQQSRTENWSPTSGSYSLSVEYVWTDETPVN